MNPHPPPAGRLGEGGCVVAPVWRACVCVCGAGEGGRRVGAEIEELGTESTHIARSLRTTRVPATRWTARDPEIQVLG